MQERFKPLDPVKEDEGNKLPAMEKLPPALQKIVDNEESLWDRVSEGQCVFPNNRAGDLAVAKRDFCTPVFDLN